MDFLLFSPRKVAKISGGNATLLILVSTVRIDQGILNAGRDASFGRELLFGAKMPRAS